MNDRRRFLKTAALGAAATALSPFADAAGTSTAPAKGTVRVVSTWDFGIAANHAACAILSKGGHALDAVEAGALQFALEQGFKKQNLLTPAADKAWHEWLKTSHYQPEINGEVRDYGAGMPVSFRQRVRRMSKSSVSVCKQSPSPAKRRALVPLSPSASCLGERRPKAERVALGEGARFTEYSMSTL